MDGGQAEFWDTMGTKRCQRDPAAVWSEYGLRSNAIRIELEAPPIICLSGLRFAEALVEIAEVKGGYLCPLARRRTRQEYRRPRAVPPRPC